MKQASTFMNMSIINPKTMISMDFSSLHLMNSSIAAASLIFILIISLYYFLILGHDHKHDNKLPPEPNGAWPLLGHLRLLRGPKLLHITLSEMADKHGPIFSIRLGIRRAIVVNNWELAKQLSTTHDKNVASRARILVAKHLGYNYAMFGVSPYGSYWRKIRKFVSLELLSTRRLNLLEHIRASETKASIQQLYKLWAEKGDHDPTLIMGFGTNGVMVEMRKWISDLTTNVIFRMIYGKRYSGTDVDKDEAQKCQRIFKKFLYLFGVIAVGDVIPWLQWLDIGGHEKAMKETFKEYDQLLEEWLQEHYDRQRHCNESNDPNKVDRDFMDVMITKLKNANLNAYDTDTINKATCSILNVGGADTVATMLTWTLCLLVNHSHVLAKVEEELDIHVGKGRNVEESDIPNLVYLQAVIKESLRLYPPFPLGGLREVIQDFVVDGYHIEAGTRVFFNLWKLQRDPNIWPEPSEFRPERFMNSHNNVDVFGQNFELIPFGAGRRICPGINLGMQMGHLVLASLLHSFQLSNPNNELIDMTGTEGITMHKATPLDLIITPKLPRDLYA